jgi:TatD DNase family protein
VRLTDTHCHLYFRQYQNDLDEVISRAVAVGLERILIPGVDLVTSLQAIQLADSHQIIYSAVGVHPNSGLSWKQDSLSKLDSLAAHPKVVAIGEIGLDYYREQAPRDLQQAILKEQLNLASEKGLPVILHVRNTSEDDRQCMTDMLEILDDWVTGSSAPGSRSGVMHSFSGNIQESQRAVQAGFYLGIVGFVTFKNAGHILDVIRECDHTRLLVETDGPFISPHPRRGKRNEPAHVRYIVDKISEIVGITSEAAAQQTAANAKVLFNWE